jgi:ELWxxDGT repeat protein
MMQVFFGRTDNQHGDELWATNGTAAGSYLVADLEPGPDSGRAYQLTPINHTLLFSTQHDGELWKSDGTPEETGLVKELVPGGRSGSANTLTVLGDKLVFYGATTDPAHGDGLWVSDGTEAGTTLLASFAAANFTKLYNIGSQLLFFADDGEHGRELWHTDGTVAGTGLVIDLVPGSNSPVAQFNNSYSAGVVNGELWFSATTDPFQPALDIWKSDGTASGTVKVASHATVFGPSSNSGGAADFTDMNGTAFFFAGSNEIWRSDGTESGTVPVTDNGVAFATEPLLAINGTLFFAAGASASTLGLELWKSDGTPHSMTVVKDINPAGSSSPHSFVAVGNELYFLASTYNSSGFLQTDLWKSDGTDGGTQQVTFFEGAIENLTNVNGTLYFDAQIGNEQDWGLWKTDGTSGGTIKIADNVDPGTGIAVMDTVSHDFFFTNDADIVTLTVPGQTWHGLAGDDVITGTGGDDIIFGDAGSDTLIGGDGNDVLVAHTVENLFSQEHDSLSGGAGNDTLYGEAADTLDGGPGFDVLQVINDYPITLDLAAAGIEYVISGFGDDTYTATAATTAVEVYGGGGNDQITGGAYDDRLWGGAGNDTLTGDDGNDVLVGDLGADSLSGGAGNDRLYVDDQDTFIDGGPGFDAAYIASGTGTSLNLATMSLEWVADFAGGNDTIDGSGTTANLEVYAAGGADIVIGGSGADFLWGGAGDDIVTGNAGDDTLVGGAGADRLTGGPGTDALYGNSGNGGDGAVDTFVFTDNWGTDFVFDFEHGIDKLDMSHVAGVHSMADLTITNVDGHAHIAFGANLISVANMAGQITQSDFLFA